jgi:hypothetical protein
MFVGRTAEEEEARSMSGRQAGNAETGKPENNAGSDVAPKVFGLGLLSQWARVRRTLSYLQVSGQDSYGRLLTSSGHPPGVPNRRPERISTYIIAPPATRVRKNESFFAWPSVQANSSAIPGCRLSKPVRCEAASRCDSGGGPMREIIDSISKRCAAYHRKRPSDIGYCPVAGQESESGARCHADRRTKTSPIFASSSICPASARR